MKININQRVKARLTEYGFNKLKERGEVWATDADGRIHIELWELMRMTGPLIYMGGPQVIEANSIELET